MLRASETALRRCCRGWPARAQVAGLALAPESPVWLRWRGRRAAAELAEQRLLGPAWRAAVGEPEEEGALLENGGEVRTPTRVSCWDGMGSAYQCNQSAVCGSGACSRIRVRCVAYLSGTLP